MLCLYISWDGGHLRSSVQKGSTFIMIPPCSCSRFFRCSHEACLKSKRDHSIVSGQLGNYDPYFTITSVSLSQITMELHGM
ncbi:hypothetical protein OIU77_011480 [Salix suchowensis]|uniref:Uncharacterized protein n=1 Tax=Salix suchowensis TaxID=1278906 RepID=A0ABQ9A1C1_9ROSI|nr:hypothetical protein OIU77_011480 [Salix suchowensis]